MQLVGCHAASGPAGQLNRPCSIDVQLGALVQMVHDLGGTRALQVSTAQQSTAHGPWATHAQQQHRMPYLHSPSAAASDHAAAAADASHAALDQLSSGMPVRPASQALMQQQSIPHAQFLSPGAESMAAHSPSAHHRMPTLPHASHPQPPTPSATAARPPDVAPTRADSSQQRPHLPSLPDPGSDPSTTLASADEGAISEPEGMRTAADWDPPGAILPGQAGGARRVLGLPPKACALVSAAVEGTPKVGKVSQSGSGGRWGLVSPGSVGGASSWAGTPIRAQPSMRDSHASAAGERHLLGSHC